MGSTGPVLSAIPVHDPRTSTPRKSRRRTAKQWNGHYIQHLLLQIIFLQIEKYVRSGIRIYIYSKKLINSEIFSRIIGRSCMKTENNIKYSLLEKISLNIKYFKYEF